MKGAVLLIKKSTNSFYCQLLKWLAVASGRAVEGVGLRSQIVGSNPTGGMHVSLCECCVLLSRGLCDELITRLDESYRVECLVVCDLETS